MPVVDRTLILRKLSNLEEYYAQIEEYKGIALEQYTKRLEDPAHHRKNIADSNNLLPDI